MSCIKKVYIPETTSTNTILKELCRDGAKNGLMVYTYNQTKGYGRQGKHWYSEKDNSITMSISLLQPPLLPEFPLSIIAGVAVLRAVSFYTCATLSIKWPNDILLNGRKLCGISCERVFLGDGGYAIVGIGVNVNNSNFPKELSDIATSLFLETDNKWDIMQP